MIEIFCSGTPLEVGRQHGQAAQKQIRGSLAFYAGYFERKARMDWPTAVINAQKFLPALAESWPDLVEEMEGVAEGAGLPFEAILALNARTEISMGMMDDGCTSLAWMNEDISFVAQNWDWEDAQKENLIALHIKRTSKPSISQITEAGILGKIGLNSAGVGVCLNAIRVKGVDFTRLPAHLALRVAMDSTSRAVAVETLEKAGVAAAIHILVADHTGATSIECSALDTIRLEMKDGKIAHSNHFLVDHATGVKDSVFMEDSTFRIKRMKTLLDAASATEKAPTLQAVERMLEDERGFPTSINRKSSPRNPSSTLFSIVIDVALTTAFVKVGRPTDPDETFVLKP